MSLQGWFPSNFPQTDESSEILLELTEPIVLGICAGGCCGSCHLAFRPLSVRFGLTQCLGESPDHKNPPLGSDQLNHPIANSFDEPFLLPPVTAGS